MSENEKQIAVEPALNQEMTDSEASSDDMIMPDDSRIVEPSHGMKSFSCLINSTLLIKLGLNALSKAQDQILHFARSNNLNLSFPNEWENIIDPQEYLKNKPDSSTPYKMDTFDEVIENGLKTIKNKHHVKAPFTGNSRTFICETIRRTKDTLKKRFTSEQLLLLSKDYKPYVKPDSEDSRIYKETVEELYQTFLTQGITTLNPKSINLKLKKSISNQETYKRLNSNKENKKEEEGGDHYIDFIMEKDTKSVDGKPQNSEESKMSLNDSTLSTEIKTEQNISMTSTPSLNQSHSNNTTLVHSTSNETNNNNIQTRGIPVSNINISNQQHKPASPVRDPSVLEDSMNHMGETSSSV
ncbi:hypothetical protein WA158_003686 [Blastocystis sp. Blastoise]